MKEKCDHKRSIAWGRKWNDEEYCHCWQCDRDLSPQKLNDALWDLVKQVEHGSFESRRFETVLKRLIKRAHVALAGEERRKE